MAFCVEITQQDTTLFTRRFVPTMPWMIRYDHASFIKKYKLNKPFVDAISPYPGLQILFFRNEIRIHNVFSVDGDTKWRLVPEDLMRLLKYVWWLLCVFCFILYGSFRVTSCFLSFFPVDFFLLFFSGHYYLLPPGISSFFPVDSFFPHFFWNTIISPRGFIPFFRGHSCFFCIFLEYYLLPRGIIYSCPRSWLFDSCQWFDPRLLRNINIIQCAYNL